MDRFVHVGSAQERRQNYGITKAADPANSILSPHIGEASDIAYGALYLASEESKFVTG